MTKLFSRSRFYDNNRAYVVQKIKSLSEDLAAVAEGLDEAYCDLQDLLIAADDDILEISAELNNRARALYKISENIGGERR